MIGFQRLEGCQLIGCRKEPSLFLRPGREPLAVFCEGGVFFSGRLESFPGILADCPEEPESSSFGPRGDQHK